MEELTFIVIAAFDITNKENCFNCKVKLEQHYKMHQLNLKLFRRYLIIMYTFLMKICKTVTLLNQSI